MDYYELKHMRSGPAGVVAFACFISILMCLLLGLLLSCKTYKTGVTEKTDTQDSVKTEVVEVIKEVPVTVYVEIPAEKKERETKDSVSHLKTQFADSWAKLLWRGDEPYLFHSLENIPQKIEKTDSVQVKETTKTVYKTRRVTYTKEVVREKRIAWWKTALMYSGALFWLIVIFLILIRVIRR